MSIKDQIRAEIDKLYGEYKDKFHQSGDQYHLGLIDGLDMAERVLDSLPEQPVKYPTSTEMIAEWENNELLLLRDKDFRGDAERMAYKQAQIPPSTAKS